MTIYGDGVEDEDAIIDRIDNGVAVFSALDKVTARTSSRGSRASIAAISSARAAASPNQTVGYKMPSTSGPVSGTGRTAMRFPLGSSGGRYHDENHVFAMGIVVLPCFAWPP